MSEIATKKLSFAYDQKKIIDNVDLSISDGQILVILGPNGIGKSTLLSCLSGLHKSYSGSIQLGDQELRTIPKKVLSHHVALVSQGVNVKSSLKLTDYLLLGRSAFHSIFSQPNQNDQLQVDRVLTQIGLEDYRDISLQDMSGGQKQLAQIGRALVQEPQLLIMDEPTSALDYKNQILVLKLIKALSDNNISIIISTHDPNQAMMVGDLVGLLIDNQTYIQGSTEEILTEKYLSDLYKTPIVSTYNQQLHRNIFGTRMD
ncbi:ABC transporter ATP-binding protein [Companilactobacillus versmoldensis]|uniref:Iron ABC transporter ATP-binding protein n=1 Tax=Companilactobacillus versmoldensis DSM 14857 = KCTC 3814 TaxID=1423815 RepID=A0A0R1SIZ1_9LACO|nr:ABC transporter ATP-binding protein [Companilactobacillus versmoldensis]KRL67508.1 iron ABC transporter ATP-binding protein [Companilactobacillus versmoldensis DSM 14857 = KCTC 3814]